MRFQTQKTAILSWGFLHVGDVGDFCLNLEKPLHRAALSMLGVEVDPNLKPQHLNMPSNLYRAGVSMNIQVMEGGYSPYGRGQHYVLAHPRWRGSPAQKSKITNYQPPTKGDVMKDHDHKTPRCILALDLGRRTGWALIMPNLKIHSGFEEFKPSRFESSGMALLRFRNWLNTIHQQSGGLGVCVFEEVRRHAGTTAAHTYGEFLGQLKAWADEDHTKVPYLGVPVGTIKKFATGKGNANKKMVIEAVQKKFGHSRVTDDNEADALALLHWAIEEGPVQFEIKGVLR